MNIQGYETRPLSRELTARHLGEITSLANLIPQVEYTAEEIMADHKGDRDLLGKWDHNLGVFDGDQLIGMAFGYERRAEGNEQYPVNTLYITELAVSGNYQRQGIAKALLKHFFAYNNRQGFKHLDGPFNYSTQTNSADWNQHVRHLYASFGFQARSTKPYDNRTDVVMGMTPNPLMLQ